MCGKCGKFTTQTVERKRFNYDYNTEKRDRRQHFGAAHSAHRGRGELRSAGSQSTVRRQGGDADYQGERRTHQRTFRTHRPSAC